MKTFRVTSLVPGLCLIVGLAGCASVDPAPFNQFTQGLNSLRDGTDALATTDVENARDRFVGKVRSGEVALPDLQLGFEPPFGYDYSFGDEPLYVKLGRFQRGLRALNDAMISYAGLLTELAGDEVVNQAAFDRLTTDLNANASTAANALSLKIAGDDTALLTTAAVAAFRGIIGKKRRAGLSGAIEEVQPQMVEYSREVEVAIEFLATGVTSNYDDQFRSVMTVISNAAGAARNAAHKAAKEAGKTDEEAEQAGEEAARAVSNDEDVIEKILALNLQTQATLEALAALSASYQRLPAAHKDLIDAASKKPGGLAGLVSFTNEALRLHTLYTDLAAANKEVAGDSD